MAFVCSSVLRGAYRESDSLLDQQSTSISRAEPLPRMGRSVTGRAGHEAVDASRRELVLDEVVDRAAQGACPVLPPPARIWGQKVRQPRPPKAERSPRSA